MTRFLLARLLSLQIASSAASKMTLARKRLARTTCSSREYSLLRTLSGNDEHEGDESGVWNRESRSELWRVIRLVICSETLRSWRGFRRLKWDMSS